MKITNKTNQKDKPKHINWAGLTCAGILEELKEVKPLKTKDNTREDTKTLNLMVNSLVEFKNNTNKKKDLLREVKQTYKTNYNKTNSKILELKEDKDKPLSQNNYNPESELYKAICSISDVLNLDILYVDTDLLANYELEVEQDIFKDIITGAVAYNENTGLNFSVILNRYLKLITPLVEADYRGIIRKIRSNELDKINNTSLDEILKLDENKEEQKENKGADIMKNENSNKTNVNKENTNKENTNKENKGVDTMNNENNKGAKSKIANKATTTGAVNIAIEKQVVNINNCTNIDLDKKEFKLAPAPTFDNLRYLGYSYQDIYTMLRAYKRYLRQVKKDIKTGVLKLSKKDKDKLLKAIPRAFDNSNKLKMLLRLLSKYELEDIATINKKNYKNKEYTKKTYQYIADHTKKELLYKHCTANNLKYDKKIIPLSNTTGASRIRGSGFIIDTKDKITLYSFCNKIIEFNKEDNSFKLCSRTMNPPKSKYNKGNKATYNTELFSKNSDGVLEFDLFNKALFFSVSSSQLVASYLKYLGVNKNRSESGKKYLQRVTEVKDLKDFKEVPKDNHNNQMFKAGVFEIKGEA